MSILRSWPEPIVRVQSLSESGIQKIPDYFIKPPSDRSFNITDTKTTSINVPLIDLENLNSPNEFVRKETIDGISNACREWGFFQVANHGVSHELMEKTRVVWHEFFQLSLEEKQKFANSPVTYEGYRSRIGTEVGAKLDWKLVSEYGQELVKLSKRLTTILSIGLGLNEDYIHQSFGGNKETSACFRANFYPKCPQPDLTHGLSPHSDPGGITLLLPDTDIPGLQIRRGNNWLTVNPIPNAFIVNIGDQVQVLSNAIYKSVEHRVIVNSKTERLSLAFFYNPGGDKLIKPAHQLVTKDCPALYSPLTFNEYRSFIRTKGLTGKCQIESLKSPR
ncbi:hypothetical protein RDI58_025288 [Solanum bulbocastanum]|uniref:Fe2OG dioxygenase domain-containing protein n=1 Tax=Solanum bulbocastanum TaxID=147425 RepID=A0AAN8Y3P7_SOLBU